LITEFVLALLQEWESNQNTKEVSRSWK